ncbi:GGDEF domain-containing protein [Acidovorax sp. DW039]|uniref:GGDEF domain-containing protein n=1 Tax=Acidovorax sp. DW039 TaxID=3095606 RepID=UPI00308677BA|nr:GGDEF domain-containing protein [Acidovorax sp. DW039]
MFEVHSLAAMSGLMAVVLGVVLLGVRANYPTSIRGLRHWGLAPLLCGLATVTYMVGGFLPAWVSVLGGNGLLMMGFAYFLFGTQRFLGLPDVRRPWYVLFAVCLTLLALFLWVQPDYRFRVFFFTSTLAVTCVVHVRVLWRNGKGFANRLTACALIMQSVVLVVRGVWSLWMDSPFDNRFTPSLMQSLYLGTYSFAVLLVCVGVLLMASERVRSEFEHLATHDSLTGALARRAVLELADSEMQRWQRYGHTFSVLMLDVDHFKQINDTHGHLVGDAVLRDVVSHVRGALRASDRLGRYGGEEFLVLMPATDLPAAQAVAERVAATVRNAPVAAGGPHCTVSIGVTSVGAGDANFDVLLARADAALYRAKSGGRDRVVAAEPGIS